MTTSKKSILTSLVAILVLFSMFVGTTFAWFTDIASSSGNVIQAGTLDIALMKGTPNGNGGWTWTENKGEAIFDYDNWEPGYTTWAALAVENHGSLAARWKAMLSLNGAPSILADVIEIYSTYDHLFNPDARPDFNDGTWKKMGTVRELLDNDGLLLSGDLIEPGHRQPIVIALHMREDAGNAYQGLDLGATFDIQIIATQAAYENDSFDNQYDSNSEWPYVAIKYSVSKSIVDSLDATTGNLTQDVTIGNETDNQFAKIPANVKLANGTDELVFTVTSMEKPNADVNTTSRDEILRSVDIHVEGIAEDNTVPMTFVLKELFPKGLNGNNVMLYHVEGNETKKMTYADTPVNHNEFSYDPLTGDAVITIASFSEVATYADTDAGWDGTTVDYTWYDANATELTIANANQFVAFRNIVDGVEIDGVDVIDDFKDQKITLSADINLNGHNFDPIGWGYDNINWNKDKAAGKVFKGHFDGADHTIFGLYQSGWDLESSTGTDYTYTNCGGGLFAAALDATFENLTIDGAYIRFECVEIGVLLGLAQGSCNFTDINITGCKIANYQRPTGGVVGEVSPKVENGTAVESTHTFTNVYVDSNTVVGSLWGDFDAPCGGVIGSYWDDANMTKVAMNGVTVACRMDVYNDVTSTYQWYAYRRAGMLIGNTDHADGHTATAPFLSCSDVTVYYGEWADYHYCEFNAANPNWPWVRVEPGENCSGYSNPRWGRPIDPVTGGPVTDSVHEHGENEGHLELISFHQLYGGGQGVYGNPDHNGVSEGIYTVTYMDHGEVLHVDYVTDNTVAYDCEHTDESIWPITNVKDASGNSPSYWVTADNTTFTGVNAKNTANVIVYPKWPNEYTVRCLDTYGDVAYYNFVTDDKTTDAEYEQIATDINNTLVTIQNEVDKDKKVMIIVWQNDDSTLTEVTATDIKNSVDAGSDFILEAVPQLQETSITLERYYDPDTGELVAYYVTEVAQNDENTSVVIPDYVGNVPVTVISDSAAEGFEKLHATTIPGTIEKIGNNAFASTPTPSLFSDGKFETQTFYYDGDPTKFNEQLQEHLTNGESAMFSRLWDSGLGTGSRIFFLKEGKVDLDAGYWELTDVQIEKGGTFWSPTLESEEYVWTYYSSVSDKLTDFTSKYTGDCDCGCGTRPDEDYWTDLTTSTT